MDCKSCEAGKGEYGTCPYEEEINDNKTTCNCCKECRQECVDDV